VYAGALDSQGQKEEAWPSSMAALKLQPGNRQLQTLRQVIGNPAR
jgi:hypothetical protein